MRRAAFLLAFGLPLAACASGPQPASRSSVAAVVQDEGQRQTAARAAEATANSSAAMARVGDGPKDEKPNP